MQNLSQDQQGLRATTLGRISSYYYLHHSTLQMFNDDLMPESTIAELLKILSVRFLRCSYSP
jgi:hypothetical protein